MFDGLISDLGVAEVDDHAFFAVGVAENGKDFNGSIIIQA